MGLYAIQCPQCETPHFWFSGNLDQRCAACRADDTVEIPLPYVRCTCSPMGPTAAGGRHNQGCPLDTPQGTVLTVTVGTTYWTDPLAKNRP